MSNSSSTSNSINLLIKQVTFFIMLIALGFLMFSKLSGFLPPFLGAVTFYVLMRNTMRKLVYQRKWNSNLAASILIFLSVLIVLVPLWTMVGMLSGKITYVVQHFNNILSSIKAIGDDVYRRYNVQIFSDENINKASAMVANTVPNIVGATFNTLTAFLLMYFMLYFMLINSKSMESWLAENIPLKNENINLLGKEFHELVFNNAIGVPLIALAQGFVGLIAYLALGLPDAWFWFAITAFSAMIPFIGTALAYVPLGILTMFQGPLWKGIVVIVYGIVVIGLTDNVFRFLLQRYLGNVHPLITVFGVILGLKVFGFIGLIFGPILISLFVLLVRIYMNEFYDEEKKE